MPRKKIALIHFAYYPHIGGVELLIREHAQIFSEEGYLITVLTGSGKSPDPHIKLKEIKEFQSLLNFDPPMQKRILDEGIIDDEFHALSAKIETILEKELQDQDVVIVHNMLTLPRNLAFIKAFEQYVAHHPGKKYIAWTHDHFYILEEKIRDIPHVASSPFEQKTLLTPIKGVTYIAISNTFRKLLSTLFNMSSEQIPVVTNGVAIKNFLEIDPRIWTYLQEKKLLDAFPLICSPVNILPRKNLEYSLEILYNLKKIFPNVRYIITGKTSRHRNTEDYLVEIKMLLKKYELENTVLFLSDELSGSLTDSEIHDLYSISDLIFYFSKSENFGIPILEAGLSKTPIFVSDLNIFHEVAENNAQYINTGNVSPYEASKTIEEFVTRNAPMHLHYKARTTYNLSTILREFIAAVIVK